MQDNKNQICLETVLSGFDSDEKNANLQFNKPQKKIEVNLVENYNSNICLKNMNSSAMKVDSCSKSNTNYPSQLKKKDCLNSNGNCNTNSNNIYNSNHSINLLKLSTEGNVSPHNRNNAYTNTVNFNKIKIINSSNSTNNDDKPQIKTPIKINLIDKINTTNISNSINKLTSNNKKQNYNLSKQPINPIYSNSKYNTNFSFNCDKLKQVREILLSFEYPSQRAYQSDNSNDVFNENNFNANANSSSRSPQPHDPLKDFFLLTFQALKVNCNEFNQSLNLINPEILYKEIIYLNIPFHMV